MKSMIVYLDVLLKNRKGGIIYNKSYVHNNVHIRLKDDGNVYRSFQRT